MTGVTCPDSISSLRSTKSCGFVDATYGRPCWMKFFCGVTSIQVGQLLRSSGSDLSMMNVGWNATEEIFPAYRRAIPFYLKFISARCLSTRSVFGCITKFPTSFGIVAVNVLNSPGLQSVVRVRSTALSFHPSLRDTTPSSK